VYVIFVYLFKPPVKSGVKLLKEESGSFSWKGYEYLLYYYIRYRLYIAIAEIRVS
jgi:hypothetical protein